MILAGLCFKVAAVPFHFYAPDVYQGTTHPNAAMLSVVPKGAGLAALARLLAAMPGIETSSWPAILAVAVLSMTVGNVMALLQKDLRRLLAYSSIAQAGYSCWRLAAGVASAHATTGWDGVAAMALYLVAYALATIGIFAAAEHWSRPDHRLDAVAELAGLGLRPAEAAVLTVCLLSLTGPAVGRFLG